MDVTKVVLVDVWSPIVVHEIVNASVKIRAVFFLVQSSFLCHCACTYQSEYVWYNWSLASKQG